MDLSYLIAGISEMYFSHELTGQAFNTEVVQHMPDIDFVFGPKSLLGAVLFFDGFYRLIIGRGPLDRFAERVVKKIESSAVYSR